MKLAHPNFAEQEDRHRRMMARLRPEAIAELLRGLGIKLQSGGQRPMAMGAVNTALALTTSEGPMVLRIANAHSMFIAAKTRSEVEVMRWVGRQTGLPLPEVVDFCDQSASSALNCEYMLMRRAPGVPLAKIWSGLHVGRRLELAARVAGIIAELQRVALPHGRFLGGFRVGMRPGCLRGDRPNIGPFRRTSDSFRGLLDWTRAELENCEEDSSRRLRCLLTELRAYVQERRGQLDRGDRLGLCHNDLNLGNLLVDPVSLEITAILDWEHAACASLDEQLSRFFNFGSEGNSAVDSATLRRLAHRVGLRPGAGWRTRQRIGRCVEAGLECAFFIAAWYRGGPTAAARRQDHEAHMREQRQLATEVIERELRQLSRG